MCEQIKSQRWFMQLKQINDTTCVDFIKIHLYIWLYYKNFSVYEFVVSQHINKEK